MRPIINGFARGKHSRLMINHFTLEFREFSKRTWYSNYIGSTYFLTFNADSEVVYKIPYRRAPRLAFRPSASREQRYLAYKFRICMQDTFARARTRATIGYLVYKFRITPYMTWVKMLRPDKSSAKTNLIM